VPRPVESGVNPLFGHHQFGVPALGTGPEAQKIDAAGAGISMLVPAIPDHFVIAGRQITGIQLTHQLAPQVIDAEAVIRLLFEPKADGGIRIEGVGIDG